MKLSKYKEDYYWFSGKASDVARHLALAGIAIVWIFKVGGNPTPKIPKELLLPSAILASALAADLFQYISATIIWGWFHRHHEKRLKDKTVDPELTASRYLNWPAQFFFTLKLTLVILAYALLFNYMWKIWFASAG